MNEVATKETTTVMQVIERLATDPNVAPDSLERMLAANERVLDRDAKNQYNADMALLQSEMPEIAKTGEIKVGNDVRSRYAKYEDINKAVKPLLAKYGFSATFKTEFEQSNLRITGIVSHRAGHKEETSMTLPFDTSGSKNAVQAIGSSVQYGKRYCLCMLFNISTGGEDDDAVATGQPVLEKEHKRLLRHNEALRDNLDSVLAIKAALAAEEYSSAYEYLEELDAETRTALWVATTKGGIWTTQERDIMKSDEWSAVRKAYHNIEEQA